MKRKILSLVIAVCVLTSIMSVTAFASEADNQIPLVSNVENSEMTSVLADIGVPSAIIDTMPLEDATNLIQAYEDDPASVSISSTVMEVDVLSELETFVNSSHDELINMGLTDEDIKKTDEKIQSYREMSDEELSKELGADDVGTKLFKDAITPDDNYEVKNSEMDVSASGTVSSAKLTYTQSCTSYNTPNSVKYYVGIYFAWNEVPEGITPSWNDNIVTAWGGNLTQSVNHKYTQYYNVNTDNITPAWSTYNQTGIHIYTETTVNAGGYYTWPQYYAYDGGTGKFGSVGFYISQNANNGLTTKVVSQFAHRALQLGSTSISTSGLTLEIGGGYDKSVQQENIITY